MFLTVPGAKEMDPVKKIKFRNIFLLIRMFAHAVAAILKCATDVMKLEKDERFDFYWGFVCITHCSLSPVYSH